MTLSKSQKEAIYSKSKITALIGGYGSGKTYASAAKAILNQGETTIVVISGLEPVMNDYIKEIKAELKEYNHDITVIPYHKLNDIKQQDLIILENLDVFSYQEATQIYHKVITFTQKILITACPLSDYPLEANFVYALCKEHFVSNIHMQLTENIHLPEEFLERLDSYFDPFVYNLMLKGNFVYREEKDAR